MKKISEDSSKWHGQWRRLDHEAQLLWHRLMIVLKADQVDQASSALRIGISLTALKTFLCGDRAPQIKTMGKIEAYVFKREKELSEPLFRELFNKEL